MNNGKERLMMENFLLKWSKLLNNCIWLGYWTHYQQVITSNELLVMGVTSNGITSNGLNKMGILQIFPLVLKAYFHWLDKQICESDNSSNWTDLPFSQHILSNLWKKMDLTYLVSLKLSQEKLFLNPFHRIMSH